MIRLLPDLESVVVAFLQADADVSALVDDRISTHLDSDGTLPAVRIQRSGGRILPMRNAYVDQGRIRVEAWGDDEDGTWEVAATAYMALLGDGINSDGIRGVYDDVVVNDVTETIGLFSAPDPVTSRARYLFEVGITAHKAA